MHSIKFVDERDFYRKQLTENILPFWLRFSRDSECGGYNTCLERDGSVFDYDKICTWGQGRIIWTFAFLYNEFEQNSEWLDMALHGCDFMKQFGFDESGRVYYSLSREGTPLGRTRGIFADLFLAAGFAECWKATGQHYFFEAAKNSVFTVAEIVGNPKTNPHRRFLSDSRQMSLNAEHMILLNTVQRLRELDEDERYDQIARTCVDKILTLHFSEESRAVLEAVAPDGSSLPGSMGRWINPGHMIELGWFLIHEGQYLKNDDLIAKGINAIVWGMDWGWDEELGGIVNDIDIEGKCLLGPQFLYAPFKMWWAVVEALYSNLLAFSVTGRSVFLDSYQKVRDWSFEHFEDKEYGEWYGYLDHSGNLVDAGAKGTDIKTCYHIARSFFLCYRILDELAGRTVGAEEQLGDQK